MEYLYGPVYSRRLGLSLGVDLFSKKVCTFNCIYCQLGRTPKRRIRRFSCVDLGKLREQLMRILKNSPKIDYITISGSGEPTLHKGLDRIIEVIKRISKNKYPVCVITNSSLLYRREVRNELKSADLVIPSLDAPNQDIFTKINCPYLGISFNKVLKGLLSFREEYKGKIWLEIMVVKDINDKKELAYEFKRIISQINPDKVQLNTPTRPTPLYRGELLPSPEVIKEFKTILGRNCEIISFSRKKVKGKHKEIDMGSIIHSLRRRPQSIEELASSLGVDMAMLKRYVRKLISQRKLYEVIKEKRRYLLVKR
jgi:wyosine [tRNA(Phe)-imidazoG37] synthetase (radical SAM superfamily)